MDPLTRLRPDSREVERFAQFLEPAGRDTGSSEGLARLAHLADRLADTGRSLDPAAGPSAEFRDGLRTRLLAVAAVQGVAPAPARAPAGSWRNDRRIQRALGVTAGALASVVAVSGVAVAGSQSLPGDPFYGVKRTAEALQLAAADDDLDRGTRHLQFAAARLDELRGLVVGRDAASDSGPPVIGGTVPTPDEQVRIGKTLSDMDGEVRLASELLTGAYRRSLRPSTLEALSAFTADHGAELEQLLPVLPSSSRERAAASLALVTSVGAEARELIRLGACGPGCAAAVASGPGIPTGPCDCPAPVAPSPDPTVAGPGAPAGPPEPGPAPGQAEPVDEPAPAAPGGPQPAGPAPAGPAPAGPAPAGPAPAGPGPRTPSVPVPTVPSPPALPTLAPVPGDLPTLSPPTVPDVPLDLPAASLPGGQSGG